MTSLQKVVDPWPGIIFRRWVGWVGRVGIIPITRRHYLTYDLGPRTPTSKLKLETKNNPLQWVVDSNQMSRHFVLGIVCDLSQPHSWCVLPPAITRVESVDNLSYLDRGDEGVFGSGPRYLNTKVFAPTVSSELFLGPTAYTIIIRVNNYISGRLSPPWKLIGCAGAIIKNRSINSGPRKEGRDNRESTSH